MTKDTTLDDKDGKRSAPVQDSTTCPPCRNSNVCQEINECMVDARRAHNRILAEIEKLEAGDDE